MGLLDDAIREHLDLKRRRGADPADIERAEREALGPVRRGPELTGDDAAPPESALGPDAEHLDAEHPSAEHLAPEAEDWDRFEEDPELRALEDDDEPYEPAHSPGGDVLMEDRPYPEPELEPRHAADPPPPPESQEYSPERPAPTAPHLEQETEEYELEDDPEADDDVLETTPEFLQDAPDHDRLWFEQRPPRDFDFDG